MPIAALGTKIIFEVSSESVLTFTDFTRKISADYSEHKLIGRKPFSEYLQPKLKELSFKIRLDAELGVKPRKTLEILAGCCESGEVLSFVIGGSPVGDNPWVITSVSEKWNTIYNRGELVSAEATLSLKEYVESDTTVTLTATADDMTEEEAEADEAGQTAVTESLESSLSQAEKKGLINIAANKMTLKELLAAQKEEQTSFRAAKLLYAGYGSLPAYTSDEGVTQLKEKFLMGAVDNIFAEVIGKKILESAKAAEAVDVADLGIGGSANDSSY